MKIAVIGSGISGATIANLLSKKHTVVLFDKARGPGGRASNKRFRDNLSFDHGVQYISPKNGKFKNFVKQLSKIRIKLGDHLWRIYYQLICSINLSFYFKLRVFCFHCTMLDIPTIQLLD